MSSKTEAAGLHHFQVLKPTLLHKELQHSENFSALVFHQGSLPCVLNILLFLKSFLFQESREFEYRFVVSSER
jgi:hypothetical protein